MGRPQSQGQDSVTTVIIEGAAGCAPQSLAAFLLRDGVILVCNRRKAKSACNGPLCALTNVMEPHF